MDVPNTNLALAGSLEELKAKGQLVVHGPHRPILVVYDRGWVFALDNRCPHMGFPLHRGSVEDGRRRRNCRVSRGSRPHEIRVDRLDLTLSVCTGALMLGKGGAARRACGDDLSYRV
jgi:Rieske [2Fe-2S] domain